MNRASLFCRTKNETANISLISENGTGYLFALRMRCHQIMTPIYGLLEPFDIIEQSIFINDIETEGGVIPRPFGKDFSSSHRMHPLTPQKQNNKSIDRTRPPAKIKNDLKFPISKADIQNHGDAVWANLQIRRTIPDDTIPTMRNRFSMIRKPITVIEDIFVSLI